MSRSNPRKQKPRSARATAQIVVEGFTEEAFCKHLKSIYARDCGVRVEVHNARGGSPQDVIQAALNRPGFDRTFVFFDTDIALPPTWAAKSRRAGHILITPSPCIEAFLLTLLGRPCPSDTAACKRAFDAMLPPPDKYDYRAYDRHFPKELLDAACHPLLDTLRSAFTRSC
jgi:hypothetical protein